MTRLHRAGLLIAAGLILYKPAASTAEESAPVIVCDTLVTLRVLMAEGDRDAALPHLPAHPGCRAVPRARLGSPERRAMVGGAPFECLAIKDESACVWVYP